MRRNWRGVTSKRAARERGRGLAARTPRGHALTPQSLRRWHRSRRWFHAREHAPPRGPAKGRVLTQRLRDFATNLPRKALTPSQILLVVRGHWRIENDSNWVLDTLWGEGTRAWTRNRKAVAGHHPLRVQAWLPMLAYNVLAWLKRVRLRSHPSWPQLQRALERVLLPYTTELEERVVAVALLG